MSKFMLRFRISSGNVRLKWSQMFIHILENALIRGLLGDMEY